MICDNQNIVNIVSHSDMPKNDLLSPNKEKTASKSLKIDCVQNFYCNQNTPEDEPDDDFIECDLPNKMKTRLIVNDKEMKDLFLCEICKSDLTNKNYQDREIHMNRCIDNQLLTEEQLQTESSSTNPFLLECPLCFKNFATPELRSNHIKKCGKSRGLSFQQVIKALQLQERHALERESLGLPRKPVKQSNPSSMKNPASKKMKEPKNKMQSDLQLAKALSLSLKGDEDKKEILSLVCEDNISITNILNPPSEFQNPGNKKWKNKKDMCSTAVLLLRTEDERAKIIEDKVNAIITPMLSDESESNVLGDLECRADMFGIDCSKDLVLWNLSKKAGNKAFYYVEELLEWIMPSDIETGSKLCSLSQIPGHKIITQLPCDYSFCSSNADTMSSTKEIFEDFKCFKESSVISCLQSLVGNSWMSDVDIYTSCGRVIPAHKLILALRCETLKLFFDDTKTKHSLNWREVSSDAAQQFLNYLYTGAFQGNSDTVSDLLYLAKRYAVTDLHRMLCDTFEVPESKTTTIHGLHSVENSNAESKEGFKIERTNLSPFKNESKSIQDSLCNMNLAASEEYPESTNANLEIVCNYIGSSFNSLNSQVIDKRNSRSGLEEFIPRTESIEVSDTQKNSNLLNILSIGKSESDSAIFSQSETMNTLIKEEVCLHNNVNEVMPDLYDVESCCSSDSVKVIKQNELNDSSFSTSKKVFEKGLHENIPPTINKQDINSFHCHNTNMEILLEPQVKGTSETEEEDYTCGNLNILRKFCDSSSNKTNSLKESYLTQSKEELKEVSSSIIHESSSNIIHCVDGNTECSLNEDFNHCLKINCATDKHSLLENSCRAEHLKLENEFCSPYTENRYKSAANVNEEEEEMYFLRHSNANVINDGFLNVSTNLSVNVERPVTSPEIIVFDSDEDLSPLKNCESATNLKNVYAHNLENNIIPLNSPLKDENLSEINTFVQPEIIISDSDDDLCIPIYSKNSFNEEQKSFSWKKSLFAAQEECDKNINFNHENKLLNSNNCLKPGTFPAISTQRTFEMKKDESFEDFEVSKQSQSASSGNRSDGFANKQPHEGLKTDEEKYIRESSQCVTHPKFKITDSPITPCPNYKTMVTPEIKKALKKIGVKALPRKKAVAILSHIYDETHPWEEGTKPEKASVFPTLECERNMSRSKKRKLPSGNPHVSPKKSSKYFPTEATSEENHMSSVSDSNESRCDDQDQSFFQMGNDALSQNGKEIKLIDEYIVSNEELYRNVLSFVPLNLVDFHQELKDSGIKISIQKLMDHLDEQCITFTYPRKEEFKKKQQARSQCFRKRMIAKLSQQPSSNS